MKYCTHCGKENHDLAKFCIGCGKQFDTVSNDNDTTTTTNNYINNNTNLNTQLNGSGYYTENVNINYSIKKRSTLDKVAMIVGIIAISLTLVCCCSCPIGFIVGPIAIILGIIYLVKYPEERKGKAIAGIILGAIAIVLSIIWIVILPDLIYYLKQYAYDICQNNPESDECQIWKNNFPGWF